MITKICNYCGNEYQTYPCFTASKFCSRECFGLDRKSAYRLAPYEGKVTYVTQGRVWIKFSSKRGDEKLLSRYVAEKALGKELPANAIVHHIDGNPMNNDSSNLLVLQNRTEHIHLHARMRVKELSGNPKTDKICCVCQVPKPLRAFTIRIGKYMNAGSVCSPCQKEYDKRRRSK